MSFRSDLNDGHAAGGMQAWRAELGELLKLAVPLALSRLGQMGIGLTDTLMLGW